MKPTETIGVLICTYKRPELLKKLLTSILEAQIPDATAINIYVVDNDLSQSAKSIVEEFRDSTSISFIYDTETDRNISAVRNKCLQLSTQCDRVVFVDDDEYVSETWLLNLYDCAREKQAEVVIGPVITKYFSGTPKWIIESGIAERKRRKTGTRVATGNTGNAMISRAAIIQAKNFSLGYGKSGGEDSEFFYRLNQANLKMVWCNEAEVFEYLAIERQTFPYMLKRALRGGQTYSRIRYEHRGKMFRTAFAIFKCAQAAAGTLIALTAVLAKKPWRLRLLIRSVAALGQAFGAWGKTINLYVD